MMADVSIILPFRNAARWLPLCLESILRQRIPSECRVQISALDDCSEDGSHFVFESYANQFRERRFHVVFGRNLDDRLGVGGAKNRAVRNSTGRYLCFLDADDEMGPSRLDAQLEAAKTRMGSDADMFLIGTRIHRDPADSTPRYTRWANALSNEQLFTQAYTSFGPTLLAPTWFCTRTLFDAVGGFVESPRTGHPEDLVFFYKALHSAGALLYRVDDDAAATLYRYHPDCASFSVSEDVIREIRVKELEERVLKYWTYFYIWNGGRGGRKFYKSLSEENKLKVLAFIDVDVKKLAKGYYEYSESPCRVKPRVPIIPISKARPPFVVCVKLDMTNGVLEETIKQFGFLEGRDFYFAC